MHARIGVAHRQESFSAASVPEQVRLGWVTVGSVVQGIGGVGSGRADPGRAVVLGVVIGMLVALGDSQ